MSTSGTGFAKGPASSDDREFCRSLLPRVSRTFALSIESLPDDLREPVRVAYLLCRIVDTIEDQPAAPPETRRAWFDAFDRLLLDASTPPEALEAFASDLGVNPAEHALCAGSAAVFRVFRDLPADVRARVTPHVHDMSLGMRMYGMRADARGSLGMSDLEDLLRYCYYVAGTVGELLTDLFEAHAPLRDPEVRERIRSLASSFGVGLQLVNIVKDVAEDQTRGVVYLPRTWLDRWGVPADALLDPAHRAAGLTIVREVCRVARERLDAARTYTRSWPLPEGEAIRLFCAVPLLFAYATLREVEVGPDTLVPGRTPKISRAVVADVVTRTLAAVGDDDAFGMLLDSVSGRLSAESP